MNFSLERVINGQIISSNGGNSRSTFLKINNINFIYLPFNKSSGCGTYSNVVEKTKKGAI